MDAEREFVRALGQQIRQARNQAGLTQQDLGDEVGLSRTSITNIESGNQQVTVWLLNQIAEAVGYSPADLFPTDFPVDETVFPEDVTPKTVAFLRGLEAATR